MEQTRQFRRRERELSRLLGHSFSVPDMIKTQDPFDLYDPRTLMPRATYHITLIRDVGNIPVIVALDRDFFTGQTHHERALPLLVAHELRGAHSSVSVCFDTPTLRDKSTTQLDMFLDRCVLTQERRAKIILDKEAAQSDGSAMDDVWEYLRVFHDNAYDFHQDMSQDYGQMKAFKKGVFLPTY